MVDIGKKKDEDSSKKKKKKPKGKSKKSTKSTSSSSSSSSGGDTEPYSMGGEKTANVDGGSVSDTSQRWASEGSELNYDSGASGTEKEYIKRQIKECEEFYENFLETALDNVTDINQFTLYHHALLLSMAKNRAGICDIFMDRFGYSEEEALEKTKQICKKAGEPEAFVTLVDEVTVNIRED